MSDDGEEGKKIDRRFPDNHEGLDEREAETRLAKYGKNSLPEKHTPGWVIFLRCLWGPMPIALWIAIIVEFSLENWPDGGILLFIQFANATIGWYETTKAGDAVAALKKSLKPRANVFRNNNWLDIDAADLVPGDKIKLGSGSAIPADCTINASLDREAVVPQIEVDESALTGESLPVKMEPGDAMPKMGSTVVRGEVDATVQYTGVETVFGKTALLLQAVETDLGNIHYVLVKVMYGLTSLSMVLCIICFIYLMAKEKKTFRASIEFTVVLLIVSIPIAIEIVVTTTLALGSRELSKKKVIVTRLSAIEMMSSVNMLCSDKTGTLTLNKMEIQDDSHFMDKSDLTPNMGKIEKVNKLLVLMALAAKWREPPRDALDTMVLNACADRGLLEVCDKYRQMDYKPFDPRQKRTEGTLEIDGRQFKVTKGAPQVILNLCENKSSIEREVNEYVDSLARRGIRCLTVAKTTDPAMQHWEMAGIVTFLDPERPDTKETIRLSRIYGVDVKMVTGDQKLIAIEMARRLNLPTEIETTADGNLPKFPESGDPKDIPNTLGHTHGDKIKDAGGFAQVHPDDKYLIVETLRQRGFICAMTGDGVNDAPALKRSDVGVAVHGATDAARAASDMVLTEPGLRVIVDAMLIARGVFQRMQSFLTYRVSATLQLVFFFFIAVFALPPAHYYGHGPVGSAELGKDGDYFHLPVLQFMLITLLNDGTLMAIGYDNVVPHKRPQKWNLRVLFFIAAVLAGVACVSSLLLLWMAMDSFRNFDKSWFCGLGLPRMHYDQVVTMVYLKISISDFLTLFASRTGANPFYSFAPSKILLFGACGSLTLSTLVAAFWPPSSPDGVKTRGLFYAKDSYVDEGFPAWKYHVLPLFVWAWCVLWWFIQDAVKVGCFILLDRFDIFDHRTMLDPDKMIPDFAKGDKKTRAAADTDDQKASLLQGDTRGSGYGTGRGVN